MKPQLFETMRWSPNPPAPVETSPGPNVDHAVIHLTTKETLLVVDDHPELCEIASLLLSRCGYRVLTANRGEEAWEIARRNPDIALLLTDIEMPGISGEELAEWFLLTRPSVAIVFLSATPPADQQFKNCRYIKKPFIELDTLLSTIRETLQHRQNSVATAAA
jgi:CheY-like chemotaxis protein